MGSKKSNIAQFVEQIPCSVFQTLETDEGQAQQFVQQLEQGQVPDLVQNLPQEAVAALGGVFQLFDSLGTDVVNVAEAAVTDVSNVFNEIEDGSITSVIAALPSEIAAGILNDYSTITDIAKTGWSDFTCFFKGCPSSADSGGSCATATTSGAAPTTYATPTAYAAATTTYNPAAAASYSSALSAYYVSLSAYDIYLSESSQYIATSAAAAAAASESSVLEAPNAATTTAATNRPPMTTTSSQNKGQNPVQSTTLAATQSTSHAATGTSTAALSYEWTMINGLTLVAFGIFGIALWL